VSKEEVVSSRVGSAIVVVEPDPRGTQRPVPQLACKQRQRVWSEHIRKVDEEARFICSWSTHFLLAAARRLYLRCLRS
jgi:hypothetical protein